MGKKAGKVIFLAVLFLVSCLTLASAATIHGSIYDLDLKKVENTLLEINTEPQQQYLSHDGTYSFNVPEGRYTIKAKAGTLSTSEQLKVSGEGNFVFDLFLFPGMEDEEEILADLNFIPVFEEEQVFFEKYPLWSYLAASGIILIAIGRIILAKKRYPRNKPRENKDIEIKLSVEEAKDPDHLDEALKIIRRYEGRITQKDLRKEMMHLSEAKVSLILTDLEHKGKVSKIKKGRGNVILLK